MNLLQYHMDKQNKKRSLMEVEHVRESDLWEGAQIQPIPRALPAETYRAQNNALLLITGDPFNLGKRLDFQQGYDNRHGFFGTCMHTTISNICAIAGVTVNGRPVTEPEVLEYALRNGLSDSTKSDGLGGATTIGGALRILEHYRLPAHCEFNLTSDCGRIAACIEGGYGVICGLNSRILRGQTEAQGFRMPKKNGAIIANHAVCMTATVRDQNTGALLGFYMCDSSSQRPDGATLFVPLDLMKACYEDVDEGFIIVTNCRIR